MRTWPPRRRVVRSRQKARSRRKTGEALDLADEIFPEEWQDAGAAADFDVIRTSLDRVVGAVRAGEYGKAEQARLEAYALSSSAQSSGCAGSRRTSSPAPKPLLVRHGGTPGLAQLIKGKASPEEVVATREALDSALADPEAAVGAGPSSAVASSRTRRSSSSGKVSRQCSSSRP